MIRVVQNASGRKTYAPGTDPFFQEDLANLGVRLSVNRKLLVITFGRNERDVGGGHVGPPLYGGLISVGVDPGVARFRFTKKASRLGGAFWKDRRKAELQTSLNLRSRWGGSGASPMRFEQSLSDQRVADPNRGPYGPSWSRLRGRYSRRRGAAAFQPGFHDRSLRGRLR